MSYFNNRQDGSQQLLYQTTSVLLLLGMLLVVSPGLHPSIASETTSQERAQRPLDGQEAVGDHRSVGDGALPLAVAGIRYHDDIALPDQDKSVPAVTLPPISTMFPLNELPVVRDEIPLIIQLRDAPISAYLKENPDLPGALSTPENFSAQEYAATLSIKQEEVIQKLETLGIQLKIENRFTLLFNGFSFTTSRDNWQVIQALPEVKAVHLDGTVHATLGESVPLIGADAVWAMADGEGKAVTGQGIRVAILDTGIDYTHPALGDCFGTGCKVMSGYDLVNNDSDPMDDQGHGTHVAGIVAADGAVTGVAPDASLMAYKVLDASGSGYDSDIIAAIEMAVDPDGDPLTDDGADVINMSLGGGGTPDDPLGQAVDNAFEQGVMVVVSAGNAGPDYYTLGSPGVARNALTVAASDDFDQITNFSSRGPVEGYEEIIKPDITAPGAWISSTQLGGGTVSKSGTSMSAPHMAGAAALLQQRYPSWSPGMVKARLMNTALPLDEDPYTEGAGRARLDQAATTTSITQPVSLYMGMFSNTSAMVTLSKSLTVHNISESSQTYLLSLESGLPSGVTGTLSENSLTLNAGEEQSVTLTLEIDTTVLSDPSGDFWGYDGAVRLETAGGVQEGRIPFLFQPGWVTASEKAALEAIYTAANGDTWANSSGWLTTDPVCSWYGVRCLDGHVAKLDLTDNNLSGSLASDIGDLIYLKELHLSDAANDEGDIPNQLSGSIPSQVGNLSNLEVLHLKGNELSGSLSSAWGGLTALEYLNLANNQLSGELPAELGNLTNIYSLWLYNNQFSGAIPSAWGNLTNLLYLGLYNNQLSGELPSELRNLTNLYYLGLSDNQLSGKIPNWLNEMGDLGYIYLQHNQFSGAIPAELGELPNLRYLWLSGNQLTGEPPSALSNLALRELKLDYNQLTGNIPTWMGDFSDLISLGLGGNQFTGELPVELTNLVNLSNLYVSDNQLSGTIPPSLGNMTNLSILELDGNQLQGAIPSEIGQLTNLQLLYLDRNALAGDIPSSITNLTNLLDYGSNFGFNMLESPNSSLTAFLDTKDYDWDSTQTIPPANLQIEAVTHDTVELSWSPHPVYSRWRLLRNRVFQHIRGVRIPIHGKTDHKSDAGYTVDELTANTDYYFVVRTYTPAHGSQQNPLTSSFSAEISVTTEQTPTHTPLPSATLSPSTTSTHTLTPTTILTLSPTATTSFTSTATLTLSPTATTSFTSTATLILSPTTTTSITSTATLTPPPTATSTFTPTATFTPAPTHTPTPTNTPDPSPTFLDVAPRSLGF